MTLSEYYTELTNHDWFYAFSDDNRVYNKGRIADAKLFSMTNLSPEHLELYNAFKKSKFNNGPVPPKP